MLSSWSPARTRTGLAIAVPVIVGAVLAGGWLADQHTEARTRAESTVHATVAVDVTIIRTELREQMSAATTGTQRGDTNYRAADVHNAPISDDAAFTARDSGAATLDDTARPPAVVVPVYRGGKAPPNTEQRRAAIVAYRVVPLAMHQVLSQLVPQRGGLSIHGPTHPIASDPGPTPGGALSYAVDMDITGSPGWVVQAWLPDPAVPTPAWFVAFVLLLLGVVTGATIWLLIRRNTESGAREQLLEKDRRIVNGLAPVLQTSLDVGEVLPAVAAHLATNLELIGLSISAPAEWGERQLFVWGHAPDTDVAPRADPATALGTGETYAVGMTRGGRGFGVLRVVAGVPLGPYRLRALHTAGDLLGSTMANAEAFAKQQELLDRMRTVDELKTVFLATASHELRTPVTAIVGFSTLLLDQWQTVSPDRAHVLVDRVAANGRRLNTLIEQLLDFSQLERGLPQADTELLNLGATVTRLLEDRIEFTAEHTLDIVVANECLVRGSSSAIERIVTNLVGNAVKYSPAGTRVTVTIECDGDTAALLVDDEGSGVPESDRERVFSRFYRGRGDSVTRTRGAGIGLAIVSEYAASMSGVASVHTAPSGGARFTVNFPAVGLVPSVSAEGVDSRQVCADGLDPNATVSGGLDVPVS